MVALSNGCAFRRRSPLRAPETLCLRRPRAFSQIIPFAHRPPYRIQADGGVQGTGQLSVFLQPQEQLSSPKRHRRKPPIPSCPSLRRPLIHTHRTSGMPRNPSARAPNRLHGRASRACALLGHARSHAVAAAARAATLSGILPARCASRAGTIAETAGG